MIVNRVAGVNRNVGKLVRILESLKEIGLELVCELTRVPGHVRELAKAAVGLDLSVISDSRYALLVGGATYLGFDQF